MTRASRRTNLTGRAAVLALVICALVLSLAYPARQYVQQRRRAVELAERIQIQEDRVQALEKQKARWSDPAYVKAQARLRLHFVMPGETSYVVIGPKALAPGVAVAAAQGGAAGTWYGRLWSSVQQADRE